MRRETGDNDSTGVARNNVVDYRADIFFERSEARHIGIGRVTHKQVKARLTDSSEGPKIGEPAVERNLIHFKIAGVQDRTTGCANNYSKRVRNRVIDRDEFEVEAADGQFVALGNHQLVRCDAVLFEFGVDKGKRQCRTEKFDIFSTFQKVRHSTDVVFMAMSQNHADDILHAIVQIVEVRQNHVDAGLMLFGEQHSAVDDQDFAVDFEHGHVSTNFADAT